MRILVPMSVYAALSGCAFVSSQDVADQKALFGAYDTGVSTDDTGDTSDCTELLQGYVDSDADGFGAGEQVEYCPGDAGFAADAGDCDDDNDAINPGADDVCDTIDNDCSGAADDNATDATDWYADTDADGYGDESSVTRSCGVPSGHTDVGGDCDDSRSDVNPGEAEQCDTVDHDCDGVAEEGAPTWYVDDDGDGFGATGGATITDCAQPTGYTGNDDDCDDLDEDIKPGAAEICNDVDDDCDGDIDDDDATISGQPTWYLDDDDDTYGDSSSPMLGCDAPADHVADDTDCDDTEGTVNPGADELCGDSIDNDCDAGTPDVCVPIDCLEALLQGVTTSGNVLIDPDGTGGVDPFSVYCDQETDGGGWSLVYSEDFESGAAGWSDTSRYDCAGDQVLGRFNTDTVTRTIDNLGIRDPVVRVQADVYRLDSWNVDDDFSLSVDGVPLYIANQWTSIEDADTPAICGNNNSFAEADYIHPQTVFLSNRSGGNIELELEGVTDDGPSNESWAVDDVNVWVRGNEWTVPIGTNIGAPAVDCMDVRDNNFMPPSGYYWINLGDSFSDPFQVYCDMERDGGGWTMFWWWNAAGNQTVNDMLGGSVSQCDPSSDAYCLGRLPVSDPSDLMVWNGDGAWAVWEFDPGNDTAMKAQDAFVSRVSTTVSNACGDPWLPVRQSGLSDEPYDCDESNNDGGQCECFWYGTLDGIESFNLDDDTLWGETAFGAGMDYGGTREFGVDALETGYHWRHSEFNTLRLYYR